MMPARIPFSKIHSQRRGPAPRPTMLYQIVMLLLEVAASVFGGSCLLRLYMQYHRIPMSTRSGNPLARFIFATSDWIVLPLRRLLPGMGRVDTGSLVAAYLIELAQFSVLWALSSFTSHYSSVLILAAFGLVRMAISGLTGLVIVYAVLSWVQTHNMLADMVERMVYPLLLPIRRVVPLVGGVDLSPLVLLVLLQVAVIVLGNLQGYALM